MREVGVGIRIDITEGLSFRGIEEVNGLINRGGRVTSIEPGGAVMKKFGEGGEDAHWTLSGCDMKVIVDDSDVESSPKTLEHNRLYKEGSELIGPYMQLIDKNSLSADSQNARAQLVRGVETTGKARRPKRGKIIRSRYPPVAARTFSRIPARKKIS